MLKGVINFLEMLEQLRKGLVLGEWISGGLDVTQSKSKPNNKIQYSYTVASKIIFCVLFVAFSYCGTYSVTISFLFVTSSLL